MKTFDPILYYKNVGWCPGPSVLALWDIKVGGLRSAVDSFLTVLDTFSTHFRQLGSCWGELRGSHEDGDMRTK